MIPWFQSIKSITEKSSGLLSGIRMFFNQRWKRIWQCSFGRYMSVLASGEPNDRVFPNTSEVSQMVLFVLWRKTIYLFECLGGTLAISKVLGGFLVSSETVSYPDGFDWKFEEMK